MNDQYHYFKRNDMSTSKKTRTFDDKEYFADQDEFKIQKRFKKKNYSRSSGNVQINEAENLLKYLLKSNASFEEIDEARDLVREEKLRKKRR